MHIFSPDFSILITDEEEIKVKMNRLSQSDLYFVGLSKRKFNSHSNAYF
jgi:hypothetical protein